MLTLKLIYYLAGPEICLLTEENFSRAPATLNAIADAVRWAERIMEEVERRWRDK